MHRGQQIRVAQFLPALRPCDMRSNKTKYAHSLPARDVGAPSQQTFFKEPDIPSP